MANWPQIKILAASTRTICKLTVTIAISCRTSINNGENMVTFYKQNEMVKKKVYIVIHPVHQWWHPTKRWNKPFKRNECYCTSADAAGIKRKNMRIWSHAGKWVLANRYAGAGIKSVNPQINICKIAAWHLWQSAVSLAHLLSWLRNISDL